LYPTTFVLKTTLLFFFLLSGSLLFAQCPTGDVNLYTQADVEEFISNYPTCEIINGDLYIGDATDISGITAIKRIEGSLLIGYSEITSVSNFSQLEFIGGDFEIDESREIEIIEGINSLQTVGGNFYLKDNDALAEITGFNSLTTVEGKYSIIRNHSLETISDFANLTSIGGWFAINNNEVLLNISKFISLKDVGLGITTEGDFQIHGNDDLLEIDGFNALETINGNFSIGSTSLTSIQGFLNLKTINRFFGISTSNGNYSPNLVSIPLFNALETIGSGFSIEKTAITSLSGFENLTSLGNLNPPSGWFILVDNNNLTVIDGFNHLNHIYGVVQIITNNSLESLIGFGQLEIVGGLFQLNLNPSLTSLDGLESLIKVADLNFINDYSFIITDNISLTDCCAISNLLDNDGITGYLEIVGNPSNCSSEAEIREECTPDFDKDEVMNDDDLDDDNDGILDVIEQNGDIDRDTDGDGYPDHHDLDSDNDGCYDVIEAGFTDNDINGTLGDLPDTVDVNGLIIGESDGYTLPIDTNNDGVFDFQFYNILYAGENGILDICINNNPVNLFDSLNNTPDSGGVWSPSLSSGTGIFNPSIDSSGVYTYTVSNGICGIDQAEVTVSIDNIPIAGNDGTLEICVNNNSVDLIDSLTGSPDAGGVWSPSLSSGTGIFDPAVDSSGIYIYTVSNGACSPDSSEVNVTVDILPNAGEDGDLEICSNSNSTNLFDILNGTPDSGGIWSPSLSSGTGIFNPAVDSSGIYTYTVSNSTCGSNSSEINVVVDILPNAGEDGSLEICSNSNSVDLLDSLNGTPDSGGVWSPSLSSGTGIFDPSIDNTGIYTYSISNGVCDIESSEVDVIVDILPYAGEDGTLEICINSLSVDLFDSLSGTPDSGGVWTPILSSGLGIFDPSVDPSGIYIYSVANGACTIDTSEVIVTTTNVSPINDYSINIIELSDNNSIEIVINTNLNYEYSLDGFGFQSSNIFTNLIGGDYTVYVREINGCGILQEEVSILDYPKFFTPNNDGINDVWELRGRTNENYNIQIYNRYGKLLAILTANQKSWDGAFNGEHLPSNDYWFTIIFSSGLTKNGHFALKR